MPSPNDYYRSTHPDFSVILKCSRQVNLIARCWSFILVRLPAAAKKLSLNASPENFVRRKSARIWFPQRGQLGAATAKQIPKRFQSPTF